MSRKCALTPSGKDIITSELSKGKSTLEISKIIGRYHQTVKRFVAAPTKVRKKADKGHSRVISRRPLKREAVNNPGLTSGALFRSTGEATVSRNTCYHLLKKVRTSVRPVTKPRLTKVHIQMCMKWAKKNMKVDFSKVLFTDETRATLDGPDGWSKGWVVNGRDRHQRLRRQQGGGGIMIWAGIIGGIIVGLWRVPDGTKITADAYIAFLKEHLESWLKKQRITFRRTIIFMQDNAPSHSAHKTTEYLQKLGFCGPRKMNWPVNSPGLNPIKNLWSILKLRVYENGRQFRSNDDLWQEIVNVSREITSEEI